MAAAAKPFDFAEFNAPAQQPVAEPSLALAPTPTREKTYSQDQLDAAIADARADTVKSIAAGEALKQTALLDTIAARLTDAADAETIGVENHIGTLTDIAETIVTEFCKSAAIAHPVDAAVAMLDRYLRATDTDAGATLILPASTTKRAQTSIQKALAERGGDHIAIATDSALSRGELRLDWRGGAMTQTHDALAKQIKDLFATTSPGRTRQSPKKEQLS